MSEEHEHEEESGCGGGCSGCSCGGAAVDVESLGAEAVEVDKLFKEVDNHLVNALVARKKILETLEARSKESPEMKEKMDLVLSAQHPVLIQFVFGHE